MYSEQELTKVIKEVFEAELESGALDELVSGAVDAYLVENPVDITALEGQTIAPAVVNATTSMSAPSGSFSTLNGESNPSVKPLYYHPIYIQFIQTIDGVDHEIAIVQCVILDNQSTPYTNSTFFAKIRDLMDNGAIINCNGPAKEQATDTFGSAYLFAKTGSQYRLYLFDTLSAGKYINIDRTDLSIGTFNDGVNKIN